MRKKRPVSFSCSDPPAETIDLLKWSGQQRMMYRLCIIGPSILLENHLPPPQRVAKCRHMRLALNRVLVPSHLRQL